MSMMLGRLAARRISFHVARSAKAFAPPVQSAIPLLRCASRSSAAASSKPDADLSKTLKAEIEHERRQQTEKPQNPPAPFTIEDKPGSQEIILRRSYGREDIAITCVFSVAPYDPPMEEEEDDAEAEQPVSQEQVHMTVTISKSTDAPVLEISCTCTENDVEINHVSYLESKSAKEDEMVYAGPDFDELDERIQDQFAKFLEVRGINKELGNYLCNLMSSKDNREYLRWLEKVAGFVDSGSRS